MNDLDRDQVMWEVFKWAYNNNIEISLYSRKEFFDEFPELTFRKNDKCIRQGFYPATDLCNKMKFLWKNIALELCVEPLNFSHLENNDDKN